MEPFGDLPLKQNILRLLKLFFTEGQKENIRIYIIKIYTMKTIKHITTQICVKAWRSKTFESALEDCDSDEVERIFKSIEESKMFDGWEYYSKNIKEFIVIDGKMFWIGVADDGLEVLHKYDPANVSFISSDPVCFISQRVAFLEGPSNGKGTF